MEFICDETMPFIESGHPMDEQSFRMTGIQSALDLVEHRLQEMTEVIQEQESQGEQPPLEFILRAVQMRTEVSEWMASKFNAQLSQSLLFTCPECGRNPAAEFLGARGYEVGVLTAMAMGQEVDAEVEIPHPRMAEFIFALAYNHGRVPTEAIESLMPECIRDAMAESAPDTLIRSFEEFLQEVITPPETESEAPYDWESGGDDL